MCETAMFHFHEHPQGISEQMRQGPGLLTDFMGFWGTALLSATWVV